MANRISKNNRLDILDELLEGKYSIRASILKFRGNILVPFEEGIPSEILVSRQHINAFKEPVLNEIYIKM